MRINPITNNINFKQNKKPKEKLFDDVICPFAGMLGAINGNMVNKIINPKKETLFMPLCISGMVVGSIVPVICKKLNEKHKKYFKSAINIMEGALLGAFVSSKTNKIKKAPSIIIFTSSAFLISKLYKANKEKVDAFSKKMYEKYDDFYKKHENLISGILEYNLTTK